jgi:hypothetical protein
VGLNDVRLVCSPGMILTHEIHRSLFVVINIKFRYASLILKKLLEILLTLVVGS